MGTEWRRADARARIADWRDRHLLAAAAAANAIATEAVAAVERDLDARTRDDPMDDGFEYARVRVDALVRTGCEARLSTLLDVAARELRGIDAHAERAALALLRDGRPALPPRPPGSAPNTAGTDRKPEPESTGDYLAMARGFGRRLAKLDRALVMEGVRAGARATAVLGDVVRDWTGHRARVRAHARAHAAVLLFTGSPDSPGVLLHLETAISAAADAVRKEFTCSVG